MIGRPLRILYVEDHHDTSEAVRKLLALQGYEVVTSTTLAEAMRACREDRPIDLLICDIELPDGNALGLLEQARQIHTGVQGIILSGYGMADDVAKSRTAGFAR